MSHKHKMGITALKDENFSEWYTQVITKGQLIDYTNISGCYVFKPASMKIWTSIQKYLDARFQKLDVDNVMFPLFATKAALEREQNHIKDFAPEVAWVTHAGDNKLDEPLAIRPTSEAIIYPVIKNWLQSYRDLPLKLNQWCDVVRWEFKDCVPFLRSRTFLWQEGHTCHASKESADAEVLAILDIYEDVYKELLAIPVIKGKKSKKEKFAGADYTTTCEAFISQTGRAIQACTSHSLGQNFAKMFDLIYDNEDGTTSIPWQNSWGFTTRSIGIMVMIHGDNKGLVIPPKVASIQVVIIPILRKRGNKEILSACEEINSNLKRSAIRCYIDDRSSKTPGYKFNEWEVKGVPLRIEIGTKDISHNRFVLCTRDSNNKQYHCLDDDIVSLIDNEMELMTHRMYNRANKYFHDSIDQVTVWSDFLNGLESKHLLLTPWCGQPQCEDILRSLSTVYSDCSKDKEPIIVNSGAKSLCIPLDQPSDASIHDCISPDCCAKATAWTLFGRSY